MRKKEVRILGINPHTRYLAIAILHGSELREWMVKTIGGKSISEKLRIVQNILTNIITNYSIDAIAIKKIHPARSSKHNEKLVMKLSDLSEKQNVPIYSYSIEDLKFHLLNSEAEGNKDLLMKEILNRYPCLFREYEEELNNKNPYHIRTFEAVAVALRCFHNLDSDFRKVEK